MKKYFILIVTLITCVFFIKTEVSAYGDSAYGDILYGDSAYFSISNIPGVYEGQSISLLNTGGKHVVISISSIPEGAQLIITSHELSVYRTVITKEGKYYIDINQLYVFGDIRIGLSVYASKPATVDGTIHIVA